MLRGRVKPAAYRRAVNIAEYVGIVAGLRAGLFDAVVKAAEVMPRELALAEQIS